MELTHFSLFTGIGGIDLAAEWAGFRTVGQVEIGDFQNKVLEKHFLNVPRWRDIRDVTIKSIQERGIKKITLLSGGFPCQPHSIAGKRKGSNDERDLWGEFARLISEIKPRWVLGENVPGLLSSENGRYFGRVLNDLAQMGYNVGWCSISASEIGALHKRERVFIIANSYSEYVERSIKKKIQRLQILQREFYTRSIENLQRRPQIYQPKLCRTFNGIPNQVDRIRALGNAVVPYQVYPLLKAIAEIETIIK